MGWTLAMDLGSTGFKAAVFDPALTRRGEATRPTPYRLRRGAAVELDPTKVLTTIFALGSEACVRAGIRPDRVETLALTSQAQTWVAVDRHGHPVGPMISWLDRRAVKESAELRARLGSRFHVHCSSPEPTAQMLVAQCLWWRRQRRADEKTIRIFPLPAYVSFHLAGRAVLDFNQAAMTGLFSMPRQGWWDEALEAAGISGRILPELCPVGVAMAVRSASPVLPGLRRLVLAGNDQTAGGYANDVKVGRPVATLGTALVVHRWAGLRPGPFSPNGIWGPYPGGGYYELLYTDEGCAEVDRAARRLMPGRSLPEFLAAAEDGHRKVLRRPSSFPVENAGAGLVGRGSLAIRAYAIVEAVAFRLRALFDHLPGVPAKALAVTGGGSRSGFWLQLIADLLGVVVVRGIGDALLGAAAMSLGEVPEQRPQASFEPCEARRSALTVRYERWLEARKGSPTTK